jgi:small nuclear ribonucleoprotein (snRNP)-like protein
MQTASSDGKRKQEKIASRQTLAVFLAALQGSQCIVELDNETVIRGTLESVDAGMNLVMADVVMKDVYGRTRPSASLHVRSSSVRYVHLAKGIDPSKAVRDHAKRLDIARRENYTRQQKMGRREKGAA